MELTTELTTEKIRELTKLGRALGANSFILRGVDEASLTFNFEHEGVTELTLAKPNPLLIVMCFDRSDGGVEGIETA